ncbi:MAG: hypothetical protein OEO20_01855 [Gemmatimonadota bacterium]|nr:hypothetical protein [Gemmatimonadota bacterium]MDH3477031.1 hypothetical protein [Gemmatimonadota bacterium]
MSEERDALSPELSAFLIELAIALNKHAIYPGGHPSLGPAAARLHERLEPLHATRETLRLGIARDRLVIDGVSTDPMNPVLAELAGRLHRHHLAGMSLLRGASLAELQDVLATLAHEADRTGEPLGLAPPERRNAWQSVHLHSQDYGRLELMAEGDAHLADEISEVNELWVALAQAATQTDDGSHGLEPNELAEVIERRKRGAAYDKVIVDYMQKIAGELRKRGPREAKELRHRVSSLISTLDPEVLDELLRLAGGAEERRRFLLNAAEGMSVDAVVALVRASGRTESHAISESLLRMFRKLAAHTGGESESRRGAAESALRDQVRALVNDWSLEDPNPTAYGAALSGMASTSSARASMADASHRPEPTRVVQMAIEVGETGKVLSAAIDRMIDDGSVRDLLDTLSAKETSDVTRHIWERLAGREIFDRVLGASPLDTVVLDQLVTRMGIAAAEPMLDALATSELSQTRRILLDRLTRLGPEVTPLAGERLPGAPWYLQRNLLRLIADIGVWPPGFEPESYVAGSDPRVRIEAIRILLRTPERREQAMILALKDPDPRVAEMGLLAAAESCPSSLIVQVTAHARGRRNEDFTVLAIRALGTLDDSLAVDALLELAAPKRGLFRSRAPAKSLSYLAALRALHRHWEEPRVTRTLAVAARSQDPEIRDAAMGIDREDF